MSRRTTWPYIKNFHLPPLNCYRRKCGHFIISEGISSLFSGSPQPISIIFRLINNFKGNNDAKNQKVLRPTAHSRHRRKNATSGIPRYIRKFPMNTYLFWVWDCRGRTGGRARSPLFSYRYSPSTYELDPLVTHKAKSFIYRFSVKS